MSRNVIIRNIKKYARLFGGIRLISSVKTTPTVSLQENDSSKKSSFDWMENHAPKFGIHGNQVNVLRAPSVFYQTLKDKAKSSKKRIVIASLYLGTGEQEQQLVDAIRHACKVAKEKDDFEVHILLDYVRGSRGEEVNSRTLLLPLLQEFGRNVNIYLYHTPHLRGVLRNYIPQRFNEIIGLNHMKIYLFDDSFIISGANLSDQYFVNRQDRYVLFNDCPELANFFCDLVKTVGKFSFHLNSDNSTSLSPDWNFHPYEGIDNGEEFKNEAQKEIIQLLQSTRGSHSTRTTLEDTSANSPDTWVYPLLQMGPLGINNDEAFVKRLLHSAKCNDSIYLASGYFNLTEDYKGIIIHESDAAFNILTASPEANGFYGAQGVSGAVPDAYTSIARKFYQTICYHSENARVQLLEYYREKWTFHVKGLWYYVENQDLPQMTIVGSSNFGYRSVFRDLECQVAIVTSNTQLQKQLKEEQCEFYDRAQVVSSETFEKKHRFVPYWVRLVVPVFKKYF